MRESGAALVRDLGVGRGMDVLDLACGDGTTAVPSAELGANVLGVDIARNLVAAGNARAGGLGLTNLRFEEGDAMHLGGLADEGFDLVLTMFGAMFAPRPEAVVREMVRVTRPGGRVVMGNWIPNDPTFVAQLLRISTAYSPPPPDGFISPMLWGVPETVVERFAEAGVPAERVACERDVFTFRYDGTPSGFLAEFRDHYGPTMNAYAAAAAAGRDAELHAELEALVHDQNVSGREDVTTIPAAFLRVTVDV
jgi:SAM-dependent methyltransferase